MAGLCMLILLVTVTAAAPITITLDVNGNGLWDGPSTDKAFPFGITGDIPFFGDWNGDGKDDIGIFRPGSGLWSLDSNGNNAWEVSDKSLSWGLPGDTPVIGDWNGDGKDDIGIFRPGKGIWSLDSNGNNAWDVSDKSLSWGLPGDTPVIGDWNGDGKDDIGIFRPGKGIWSLDSNGNTAWDASDKSVSWGLPGDTPVVGDWNGDGKDDIGIFRPGKGIWSLDSNGNTAWDASDRSVSWGLSGDTPVVGDWNSDGKDDIGILRPGSDTSSITLTTPNGGEIWQRGTTHTITWSYTGSPGSYVKLVLVKAGIEVGTIIASTPIGSGGTGSYPWEISSGAGLSTGSDFKVSVQSLSQPAIKDAGNAYFTLNPAGTTTPPITGSVTPVPSQGTYGAEPNPTGNPVGGGAGYTRIISPADPRVKYVVSTRDQLLTALKNVKPGEVIFVPGTANINLTGTYGTVIPGGVTLASDRGSSGSPGGRIFRYRVPNENEYAKIPTLMIGGDNVRITGLRIEGQDVIQDQLFEEVGLEIKSAINAIGRNGLEVDNCEIWGWSHAGVALENSGSAYIHHNSIHHCQARGYGYGVSVSGGTALIEANKFDYTRHAIMGSGYPNEGYEARYNIHLGHGEAIGGHHFDVHGYSYNGGTIAGNEYKIHHNTFEVTKLYALGIRGVPLKGVNVDHNVFKTSFSGYVGFQRASNGVYANVFMTNNMVSGVLQSTSSLLKE
jgi:hypothetical protein